MEEKDLKRATEGLRQEAEKKLAEKTVDIHQIAPENTDNLLYELEIHQAELEIQNEELRNIQLELRESRDRYLNLYEYAPIGYFTIDKDSRILEVNLTGAVMLGRPRSRLIKADFTRYIASDSQDTFYFHLQKVLETGGRQNCELQIKKQDESLINVLVSSIARADAHGKLTQCFSTITDVTVEKQSAALKESEKKYRNLFESMEEGFALCEMIYDAAGTPINFRYLVANPAFSTLTGLPLEHVVAHTVKELIPGIEPFWIETYGRVVQSGVSERISNPVAALGKYYEVYVWRSGPGRFACVFSDITKRRRMEQALNEAKDELEIKVKERTAELKFANEKLTAEISERIEIERSLNLHNSLLGLFWQIFSQKEYLDRVVEIIQNWTASQAVGIRALDESGNIPYISYTGFTDDFIKSESGLSLCRDQCACTRIIMEKPEPQDMEAITPGGSFSCPDTLTFVGNLTEAEKARFRGICVQTGYKTVVIVPIKYNQKILGAIHLADARASAISLKDVKVIESISSLVGQGIYRFHMEELLKKNQATLEQANRIARIGNWSWDIVTGETWWSDLVYQMFNLNHEEHVPSYEAFLSLIHPNDRELVKKSFQDALTGRKIFDIECRLLLPDGSSRTVHELGEVKFDDAGNPVRMVGTVQDITEHKRAEEQLKHYVAEVIRVQEQERKRIARELHDETSSSLISLSLELDTIVKKYRELPPEIFQHIKQFRETITRTLQDIRRFSQELHPSVLEHLGLEAALETLAGEVRNQGKVQAQFTVSGENTRLADDANLAIFRITQEALNNIQKHSGASEANISLKYMRDKVKLTIEDNGRGFDVAKESADAAKRGSLGLIGMQERAYLIGANLIFKSLIGKGTSIKIELPLKIT